ncbi:ABC transporter substrate-binding protein [Dermatobacter hominis]|uniref:ABC transporter substrate-binding protein n=1 Tax=Dermatobacter hominis TaxID=2884263 RepID=UPI001D10EF83|nr:ABC transporter substrate-binding protein [Dermatobacter hominis]UDY34909.1 ABC transporter substrate-binding protein [Dermatobacter hominis]
MVSVLAVAAALSIVAGCGASGGDDASEDESPSTTAAAQGSKGADVDSPDFGSISAPCHAGEFTVADGEQQAAAGTIQIGVPNDRGSTLRPGLQKPIWDASVAFAGWCNDQGGIGGLKIEIVDMDAKLFDVEAAMQQACGTAFAMVGGGMAQDNLQFSGKDGSDFHRCGLIDIPAYAVSTEKSESNGQVQPIPNPAHNASNTWFQDFKKLYPDDSKAWIPVWGNLPSLEIVKAKQVAVAEATGFEQVGDLNYPVAGTTDWTPLALSIKEKGAESLSWTGESADVAKVLQVLRTQGWEGRALLESNQYDPIFVETAGPEAVEGSVVRMAVHMMEEADKWPAIRKYLDLVEKYVPDGDTALLGIQSMSAWLLFATSANTCAEQNGGTLDRTCILEAAAANDAWTGGGLHAKEDLAGGPEITASPCSMLMVVKDGKYERLYPEIDGTDDDGDGFHCPSDGVTEVTADVGQGKVDPGRKI